MGSLTSQLIISLIDKVSGPAKGAAAALKGVAAAEKKLASAANAKGVDNLAKSMQRTAAAAKALGTGTAAWSSSFDAQLGKINLTEKQINRLRSAYERFQSTLKAGGVRKAGDFLPRLDQWERRTIGSLQRVSQAYAVHHRRTSRLADIRHGAHHLIYPVASGYAVARGGEKVIEKTAELGREKVREDISGMSVPDRAASIAQARDLSHRYKSVGQVEVLSHLRQLRGTLGDLHHAREMVEDVVKAQVVLSSGPGGKEGAIRDLEQITKGLEGAGYASSSEKFRTMLTAFVKGKNLFGETLTGGDFRTYIQRSKSSKYGLGESYLAGVVPTMIQHEGANQFGTAQATAFSSLVGGRQTNKAKARLRKFGILDKNERLLDQQLFVSDPYAWTMKHLLPRMEKAGMHLDAESSPEEKEKAVDFLMKALSNRNAGEFFASLIANRKVIEKDRANLAGAKGPEAAQEVIANDPFQAWESLKAQTTNMVQNLLESSSLIQGGLSTIAQTIGNAAKWFSEQSPTTKKIVAGAIEGATVAGGGFLSFLIGKKGFDWLRGGGGKAAGGALDAVISEAAGPGGKAAGGRAGMIARFAPWLIPLIAAAQPDVGNDPKFVEHLRRKFDDAAKAPDGGSAPRSPYAAPTGYSRDFTLGYQGGFSQSPSVIPPSGLKAMTKWNASHVAPGDLGRESGIVANLNQSAAAASAGQETGSAFKGSMLSELAEVDLKVQEYVRRWTGMLSFTANPTINLKTTAPTGAGGPGKQQTGDASGLIRSRHAAFSDGGNFGFV